MLTAFSTALSALTANTTAIDVVGNNLANLNTDGFKATTVSFHDLISQSLDAGGATQVGFGVGAPITLREFSQGAIQSTGGPLDAAIQGDGFFIVKNAAGNTEYTRGGNFEVDSSGNLNTATGEHLQGWTTAVGGVLNTNAPVGDITVPTGSLQAPVATTTASVDLNLDATAVTGQPSGTFATSIEIFDSLGTSHVISVTFTKTATANLWNYSLAFPNGDLTAAGTPITGSLTFSPSGVLTIPLPATAAPVLAATGLTDGAANMNITWDIFNGLAPRITQFAQPSATSALAQNGSPAANLVSVGLANGGTVLAQYSNGAQVAVGQVAMASIRNPDSLLGIGNSNYQLSATTAAPAVGLPGTGGRGAVLGGSVESSTTDIAREFTNLIVFQRAYQANARMITTADQLSQDTIALKQ
jgi:flagellar hook protein FlgE